MYLGRRVCGLKLAELAESVGLRNYGVVATSVKRYAQRVEADRAEKVRMKQVLNCDSAGKAYFPRNGTLISSMLRSRCCAKLGVFQPNQL
jgi:hypothetical protein